MRASLLLVAGLLTAGCADPASLGGPAGSPSPTPSASPTVVPWSDRSPPPPSYAPMPTAAPSSAPCRAVDLTAEVKGHRTTADGGLSFRFQVRNVGSAACGLTDWVEGGLVSGDGAVLDGGSAVRPGIGLPPQPPLEPGNIAVSNGYWTGWCGADPGRWRIRLMLDRPLEVPGPDVRPPACPEPRSRAANGFGVYTILNDLGQPVLQPLAALSVALELPRTARIDEVMRYRAVITNRSDGDLALDPCPAYAESLSRPNSGLSELLAGHALNCADAPDRIAARDSVVFELETVIRRAEHMSAPVEPGRHRFTWNFTDVGLWGYDGALAEGEVELTR